MNINNNDSLKFSNNNGNNNNNNGNNNNNNGNNNNNNGNNNNNNGNNSNNNGNNNKYEEKIIRNFGYGYLAGMAGIVSSHPFDTIKTNIQKKQMISYNMRNLYKGVTAPLFGVGLEKAIVFGTYETSKKYTNSDFISGGLAGLSASFIVTPFERIKILLQTNQTVEKKMMSRRFLFQGLSATFYRETPGFAIYFSTYNYLKTGIQQQRKECEIRPFDSFLIGAFSGCASWVFIYPQDRIKTHLQACKERQIGFKEGFKEVLSDGGYRGLYRGFHYALMRAIPLHATAFMTFELCKKYWK
jgi:solute carrier family 25 carnitine/acylcarnitine transporter 20/29